MSPPRSIVILGLSLTSSWGNGHASTYRGLVRELARRGHDVLFLERDRPWYADNRDLPAIRHGRVEIYSGLKELRDRFAAEIRGADFVMVGSYVPDGTAVGEWVLQTAEGATGFYDIDTPVTLAKLARGEQEYILATQIPRYDIYLSFTGGKTLKVLRQKYHATRAAPLYCSCDPEIYAPLPTEIRWDLGYLGTYSTDRQPPLERLLLNPARQWRGGRFVVAGSQYPADIAWPGNVLRIEHLPPAQHRSFYCAQRFTLNVTRAEMIRAGFSPSIRLFEAAACGTPIISDNWDGLANFFVPGEEIVLADSTAKVLEIVRQLPEPARRELGRRGRARVLKEHTAAHRAIELEGYINACLKKRRICSGGQSS